RVQVLVGRAGGNHHLEPPQQAPRGGRGRGRGGTAGQRGDDRVGLGQAPGAGFALGQRTVVRADHLHAARAQQLDVGDGGRVLPHAVVHRRGHRQRRLGGQAQGGDQVVG